MNNRPDDVHFGMPSPDHEPWTDPRVERSTAAVQAALGELLPDVAWRDLTVQRILERAGVSRGTFYKHYRNKDDALRAAMGGMLSFLQRSPDLGDRLFPVRELIEHVVSAGDLQDSLHAGDRLEQLWEEMRDELSGRLAGQLTAAPGSMADAPELVGRVLAGAMVELVRHVLERRVMVPAATLDARFHRMAQTTIAAFGCVRRERE